MSAIHLYQTIEKDGEVTIKGLPCKKGEAVEMIVLINSPEISDLPYPTASRLRKSDIIGLWSDRQDIKDSAVYARELRQQAQNRR